MSDSFAVFGVGNIEGTDTSRRHGEILASRMKLVLLPDNNDPRDLCALKSVWPLAAASVPKGHRHKLIPKDKLDLPCCTRARLTRCRMQRKVAAELV
jgi:hypothetical protein